MTIWILVALAIGAALLWIEATRPDRRRAALRVIVGAMAAVALLGLLAPGGPEPLSSDRLTIVTPGGQEPVRPRGVIQVGDPADARAFATLGAVGEEVRQARAITVTGWGFLPDELPAAGLPKVYHRAAALPAGITALAGPAVAPSGSAVVIGGAIELPAGDSAWVILEDPSGPRDSALVRPDHAHFELRDRPRHIGAIDYRVRIAGAGLTTADTMGIWVTRRPPPAVLILEGSPSFEAGYLKRWLAGRGGAVAVHTTVSRDRYRIVTENGAMPPRAITERVLAAYDLIVVDGTALAAIPADQRAALLKSVRAGSGLLLAGGADRWLSGSRGAGFCGFSILPRGNGEPRLVRPIWADAPRAGRIAIRAGAAVLKPNGPTPLIRDAQGDILAASTRLGDGAVAVTMLETPSRWVLEGDDELFAGYWSALIGAVARDTAARFEIVHDGPVVPDRRITLELRSRVPPRPIVVLAPTGAADTVPLAQDPLDPARWTGRYWPRAAGWHRLASQDAGFKVQAAGAWRGVEAATRLATMARLAVSPAATVPGIPPSWLRLFFWAALVAALTVLWAEDRWRRDGR